MLNKFITQVVPPSD